MEEIRITLIEDHDLTRLECEPRCNSVVALR